MSSKKPTVKNEPLYHALRDEGLKKSRAAKIANSPAAVIEPVRKASRPVRKTTSKSASATKGGTTAQHRAAGKKGGKATAKKS